MGDEILPGFYYSFDGFDIAETADNRKFICYEGMIDVLVEDALERENLPSACIPNIKQAIEKMAVKARIIKEA